MKPPSKESAPRIDVSCDELEALLEGVRPALGEAGYQQVSAQLKDFSVRIEVNLDLRSFESGSYSLEIRRQGEDWDPHRVVIQ